MEYSKIKDLIDQARKNNIKISELVIEQEIKVREISKEIILREMKKHLAIMKESIDQGLKKGNKSFSGLIGGEALRFKNSKETIGNKLYKEVIIKALAVAETNACMGKIVAGPTAGSSGIIPAVLISLAEEYNINQERLINAFFTAGGLGEIVAKKATLAGAAGGCQAECGVASAMAAGGAVEMLKGSPKQVGDAFALALKNLLGLVCDPVAGLVEIPCQKRNGFAAIHSLTAANMALGGIKSIIPPDQVIEAMMQIGDLMSNSLKETSKAGLAVTETGKRISREQSNN